jgi:threonine/homoserine/homoserine lactone efflux protein
MLGICVGFAALVLAVGLGVGAALTALPQAKTVLKLVGAAYMLWLAWKVATAISSDADGQSTSPLSFWQAAAFQWVNPKAWVMAVSAMAVYVRPLHVTADIAAVTLAFTLVTVPAVVTWTGFGHVLRRALRDPGKVRVFNIVMALLLVASIAPMIAE